MGLTSLQQQPLQRRKMGIETRPICQLKVASRHTGSPSLKYVVYATACVYRELYGKITDPKKIVLITISVEIKFSYLKCVANLSLVPILEKF